MYQEIFSFFFLPFEYFRLSAALCFDVYVINIIWQVSMMFSKFSSVVGLPCVEIFIISLVSIFATKIGILLADLRNYMDLDSEFAEVCFFH